MKKIIGFDCYPFGRTKGCAQLRFVMKVYNNNGSMSSKSRYIHSKESLKLSHKKDKK